MNDKIYQDEMYYYVNLFETEIVTDLDDVVMELVNDRGVTATFVYFQVYFQSGSGLGFFDQFDDWNL